MRIDVVTIFPDFFDSPLSTGLIGKAIRGERSTVEFIDPRSYTKDRHRTVDDTPYGGGAGMVMKAPPVVAAIEEAKTRGSGPVIMLSPQGVPLEQAHLKKWSKLDHIVLVCGRYEGFDERIRDHVDEEISIGDFVLTGGEYGALILIDGLIRLLPGTVGNADSTRRDSFSDHLLEHPHYTRPEVFRGVEVPKVLTSGDHSKIAEWRHGASLARTRLRRPDLLMKREQTRSDRAILTQVPRSLPRLNLIVACPERSMLEVDLQRYQQLVAAYSLEGVYLVVKDLESLSVTKDVFDAWREAKKKAECEIPERLGSRRQFKEAKDEAFAAFEVAQSAMDRIHLLAPDELETTVSSDGDPMASVFVHAPPAAHELGGQPPSSASPSTALRFETFDAIRRLGPDARVFLCFGVWPRGAHAHLGGIRKRCHFDGLSGFLAGALAVERLLAEA